ncbi:metallophosphoesterase family protein [Caldibacillus debilis]|uniref:DNA repair exonuclease n=1 Tax=Caldibacillus debilis GB1 TaxID=1339248 RepID=A0A420VFJ3_9BACI|nr:DNA repair exonuclease [Caldibacillus debilis]RKO62462.1 DNA repair exonuclease [Caldibacillus debilis GB1]
MFSFIHCADLHLDSPLRGLSKKEDAPVDEIRLATRRALENLVDLAVKEGVDFVLIAGDVYDGDWQDYSTGLFFNSCMARLRERGIPVYLIRGNHDAASNITRRLVLPDNVTEFPVDRPATVTIEDLRVAIHGQGYKEREVWTNLAAGYPDPVPGYFNIGLLHTSLEGAEGHERYAPARAEELVQKGYDYWALGHIHKRQVVRENPYIVFPGNIQGRHVRETGEKGCTLVKVDGSAVSVEHRPLDVLRWQVCSVDLTDAETIGDFAGRVEEALSALAAENPGYPLAVRVELFGRTPLYRTILQDRDRFFHEIVNAGQMMNADIWIEKVKFHTEPPEERGRAASGKDALSAFRRNIDGEPDEGLIREFLRDVKAVQAKLGAYIRREDATRVETEEDLEPLLQDAREYIFALLTKGGRP